MNWNGPDRRRTTFRDRTVNMVPVMIVGMSTVIAVTAIVALGAVKTGHDNCQRIHRIVTTGARIIDQKGRLEDLLKSGILTPEQYRRAVAQSKANLVIWLSADCLNVRDTP